MKIAPLLLLLFATLGAPNARAATETLQNDSFVSGQPASFQGGFVDGEIAAVRFEPGIACLCQVQSLTVLFGGDPTPRTMGILIWDDPGGTVPGSLLYSGEVQLAGSTNTLQVIDLTSTVVSITGPFRVGLVFNHDGLSGIATDADGTVDASANFIFANVGGLNFWFSSSTLGVGGDFILRATISDFSVPDADADGIPDEVDNCTNVANADQFDADDDGFGNACDADLNNDCVVNVVDLGILRTLFFLTPDAPDWNAAADFNQDSVINVVDLGIMRSAFFAAPGPSEISELCP